MLDRLKDWLPEPREIFIPGLAITIGLFIWMVSDPQLAPNMWSELWGAAAAGVIVWFVLEYKGGAVRRRAMLRENRDRMGLAVATVRAGAAAVTALLLRLDATDRTALSRGTIDETVQALGRADLKIVQMIQSITNKSDAVDAHVEIDHSKVDQAARFVRRWADMNGAILSQLPDVQQAVDVFKGMYDHYANMIAVAETDSTDGPEVVLSRVSVGGAALEVCKRCSLVISDSGYKGPIPGVVDSVLE